MLLIRSMEKHNWAKNLLIYDPAASIAGIPRLCYLAASAVRYISKLHGIDAKPEFYVDPDEVLRTKIGTDFAGEYYCEYGNIAAHHGPNLRDFPTQLDSESLKTLNLVFPVSPNIVSPGVGTLGGNFARLMKLNPYPWHPASSLVTARFPQGCRVSGSSSDWSIL
ncbi:hypothetical protein PoB_002834300 [Plakobranchus ocellatus]|uniref:Uncharacterized protein n=1 Tax=Plakobranchus ocellatus TaxID=259542 RepID=A0AAV4A3T3_9GAST|nr:hypothetical protein PoB_002834300 [Plakobranchus ocellatus]